MLRRWWSLPSRASIPDLPEVPPLQEVSEDQEAQRILQFISAGTPIGRSIRAGPDASEEIVAAPREAFQAMIAHAALRAGAEQHRANILPDSGKVMEVATAEIVPASPELFASEQTTMGTPGAGKASD